MRKCKWIRYLIINSLSLLLLLGLSLAKGVNAQRVHHGVTRVSFYKNTRNQKSQRIRSRFHINNLRKINQFSKQHRHHLTQIKHHRIKHLKRAKSIRQRRHNNLIVKNHNYGFYSNYRRDVKSAEPDNSYHEVKGNDRVKFSHPIYLRYVKHTGRHNNYGYQHGDPQSMAILPNGNLYVLFNVGHGDSSVNRLIKYNVRNGRVIKVGPRFQGGHGQGLTYNYRTHQLWTCMNHYRNQGYPRGIIPKKLLLARIDQRKLKPIGHWLKIKTRLMMGENVAFDKSNNYWNVSRNYFKHRRIPLDSLQIFRGHGHKVKLVKAILHSPTACIQNLTYNPDTNRLYVIGNGVVMSFPVNRVRNLRNRDVKVAIMNRHSEFEGMGFWQHRAYLLVHPNRILRSNKLF